jgi:hypothetical protein
MQFCQRCLGPPMLWNELTLIGMAHLTLGWRALMKSISTTSHNHTVNVPWWPWHRWLPMHMSWHRWNHAIPSKMSMFTRVTKPVGCNRNGTSHVWVESLDKVSINYVARPCRNWARFFNGCKTMGLTLGNYNWQKWVLRNFSKNNLL